MPHAFRRVSSTSRRTGPPPRGRAPSPASVTACGVRPHACEPAAIAPSEATPPRPLCRLSTLTSTGSSSASIVSTLRRADSTPGAAFLPAPRRSPAPLAPQERRPLPGPVRRLVQPLPLVVLGQASIPRLGLEAQRHVQLAVAHRAQVHGRAVELAEVVGA